MKYSEYPNYNHIAIWFSGSNPRIEKEISLVRGVQLTESLSTALPRFQS
jgi:hypothetical protein